MGGGYDLNSSHMQADPMKEILRQTILNQELTFRTQVHELHRLYTKQKTLMKDCDMKLRDPSAQSILAPFPQQPECKSLATKRTDPTIYKVISAESVLTDSLQDDKDISLKPQQKPRDLQPYSSNGSKYFAADLPVVRNSWDFIGKSNERNNYFCGDSVYYPEEVKLSLSIGGASTKKGAGRNQSTHKIAWVSSQEIIDLEESTENLSKDVSQSAFSASCGHNKHDSQVPPQSIQKVGDTMVKDPCNVVTMTDSSIGSSGICQEQNFSRKALDERNDVPCNNGFSKDKLLTSKILIDLDLNKVQLDESSSDSNDPMLAYPSAANSSGDANLGSGDSNSNNSSSSITATIPKSGADTGNRACCIDLESPFELQSGTSEAMDNQRKNADIESTSRSEDHRAIARTEVNRETVDEDTNPSVTKTMQRETDLRGSCLSPSSELLNTESTHVAETAYQPDSTCAGNKEIKLHSPGKDNGKSTEIDSHVQNAAESLVRISLESPISDPDFAAKSGSDEIERDVRDEPVRPCDSYESMVLRQTETSADDYCVSSNAFDVNEMDKKESPIKLRRGRRLKDFQKDILPSLATLSRHEIREDINIIEGVLRSREYKRLRSKAAKEENKWFTPVKGRRSRLNYVGRRYYS